MFLALGNNEAIKGLGNGKYVPKEKQVADTYPPFAKSFRISPYNTLVVSPAVKNGLLDLDNPVGISARDTWIKYGEKDLLNIPAPLYDDATPEYIAYIKATEATILKEGWKNPWMYVEDEPEGAGYLDRAKRKLQAIRQYAPHLRTMVTMSRRPDFAGLVDYYVHINFSPVQGDWLYTSCMAHSCGPNRAWNRANGTLGRPGENKGSPGVDQGYPDLGAIERPGAFIRAFAWSMHKYDAPAGLYYNTMEQSGLLPEVDWATDLYNFTGNGDGALIFPIPAGKLGFTSDSIGVSHRLFLVMESMFDLEYLRQMNAAEKLEFDAIFKGPKDFSKDYGKYQALRDRIAARLGGVTPAPSPTPLPTAVPTQAPTPTPVPTVVPEFRCKQTVVGSGFNLECVK